MVQISNIKYNFINSHLLINKSGCSPVSSLSKLKTLLQRLSDPAWGKGTVQKTIILMAVFAAWLGIVLVTVNHHEFWRDEVRAMSIAVASPSLWELPDFLRNEGHPVLWYTLLRIGYHALGSVVLPVLSILFAGMAVLIFLFRSPFSLFFKLLFVFSVLPLYEYSVMARNYGISMLLMFCFAVVYPYRHRFILPPAVILALLANTNIHALLIADILALLWLWDEMVVDQQSLNRRRLAWLGLAFFLISSASLFAVYTVLPDNRSIVTNSFHATNLMDYFNTFVKMLNSPWIILNDLIPGPDRFLNGQPWSLIEKGVMKNVANAMCHLLQISIIVALMLGLAMRIRLLTGLIAAFLLFGFLFNFVYPGFLRHQGILLIFVITLYWLNADQGKTAPSQGLIPMRLNMLVMTIVLPFVMLWGDSLAFFKIQRAFVNEVSSSKKLGEWFNSHPEFKDAIVLSEPDYVIEALPYYSAQRIYIPRESRFGKWTRFTTDSRATMGLGELLDIAQKIRTKEHQAVFIALGFPAGKFEQEKRASNSFNKVLFWTPSEWQRFRQSTKIVKGFWTSTGDENFDLYEIR